MTIAVMKFVCERNDIKLDVQKIDEFMKKIFPNDENYQMNSISIQSQYRRISEKYKDADIEGLKKSNKAVKIIGMQ